MAKEKNIPHFIGQDEKFKSGGQMFSLPAGRWWCGWRSGASHLPRECSKGSLPPLMSRGALASLGMRYEMEKHIAELRVYGHALGMTETGHPTAPRWQ